MSTVSNESGARPDENMGRGDGNGRPGDKSGGNRDGEQAGGVRAYARHRGINHNAVRKAIEAKRLDKSVTYVRRGNAMVPWIDFALADQEWERNTDATEAAKTGAVTTPPIKGGSMSVMPGTENPGNGMAATSSEAARRSGQDGRGSTGRQIDEPGDDGQLELGEEAGERGSDKGRGEPSFADSRAKRERFQAEQAELEYLRAVGRTVWAEDVEREYVEILKQVKANVLRGNSKMAVLIAAETDPAKIERLLNESDNKVFDELSRTFAADATEGTEERAAVTS